jgi:RNA recognition motif. (a.k.a. RRM, RBD, or RNP domain)
VHFPHPSAGAVLLTRHTGGQINDEEAREALGRFGDIEETSPISVADQKLANLPEGRWVKFAFFQDCRDAQFVYFLPSLSHLLELTFSQAFRRHEFFRLVNHQAEERRLPQHRATTQHRSITSPFRSPAPTTLAHHRSLISPRLVPDSHAIYIGDLPLDVTEDQIREVFDRFGKILCVDILHKHIEDSKQ